MTPKELAEVRARHVEAPWPHYRGEPRRGIRCDYCNRPWPCDAAQLLAALQAEPSPETVERVDGRVAKPESLTWEAVAVALLEMEYRYDDLRWCNKPDQCHTKAEGARLVVEDFNEAIGAGAAHWLLALAAEQTGHKIPTRLIEHSDPATSEEGS